MPTPDFSTSPVKILLVDEADQVQGGGMAEYPVHRPHFGCAVHQPDDCSLQTHTWSGNERWGGDRGSLGKVPRLWATRLSGGRIGSILSFRAWPLHLLGAVSASGLTFDDLSPIRLNKADPS